MSVVTTFACHIDKEAFGTARTPDTFFQTLEFEYHAINLALTAPYDTMQLNVRALMQDGSPVPVSPVFTVKDPTLVEISPSGVLSALAPTAQTVIYVSVTYDGFTRTDSALVSVVSGVPSLLDRLEIVPQSGDSAKVEPNGFFSQSGKSLKLLRLDASGGTLSSVLVALRSSDSLTAAVRQVGDLVNVKAVRPGYVILYVSSFAYGEGKRDSIPFVVGWPVSGAFVSTWSRIPFGSKDAILDFSPRTLTIGVGGCVLWSNADANRKIDIIFDDPAAAAVSTGLCGFLSSYSPASGNIAPFGPRILPDGSVEFGTSMVARMFLSPGEYHYHSELYGTKGVIKVCDEHRDQSCTPTEIKW